MRITAKERSSTGRNVSTSEMKMLSSEILVCGVAYDKASMAIPRWHRDIRPDSRKSGRVSPSRVKHEITLKRHLPLHKGESRKGDVFHRTNMKMRPGKVSIKTVC
jgi:Ni,Fe-hydrogenase III large subunit